MGPRPLISLIWDNIQPMGTDTIKTLDCLCFRCQTRPGDHSRCNSVRFWVSKHYWAFLRIDGLNAKGQTIKRVEVQDVMEFGNVQLVFKEMKVANMVPDKNDIAILHAPSSISAMARKAPG